MTTCYTLKVAKCWVHKLNENYSIESMKANYSIRGKPNPAIFIINSKVNI